MLRHTSADFLNEVDPLLN